LLFGASDINLIIGIKNIFNTLCVLQLL
jgi:hypothetical protein